MTELRIRPVVLAGTVLLLSACSMVPKLPTAKADLPPAWGNSMAARPADGAAWRATTWEQYFTDPKLQSLIRTALAHNRDARVAWLQVQQAQSLLTVQRADQWPTVQAGVNATRQPASTSPYAVGTTATAGLSFTAFELDLWGRVQALSESARAQWLASVSAHRTVRLSLIASVAQAYYSLWADRWQLQLAEQTLAARTQARRLQQLRYDQGVINELDWRTVQSQHEAARVSQLQAQRQWQQSLHAMAVLLGQPMPPEVWPDVPAPEPTVGEGVSDALPGMMVLAQEGWWSPLPDLPVGLPSEVLQARPDVKATEQQLVATNADVGAVRAARFPRLSLTGSAGVISDSLSSLVSDGRGAWSVSGVAAMPLLDAGRSAANVSAATARRDMALAQYEKTLQVAFREVADALVAQQTWQEQLQAQQAQAQAEAERLKLAQLRYKTGVANAIEWLDAQRSLFAAQQALIAAQLARQQAHISLFKALGGGVDDLPQ